MNLSSPNKMIWSCFRSLQLNIGYLENETNIETIKDYAAANIGMSVIAVETFINMYFRVLVEEEKYKEHKNMIIEDQISQNGKRAKGLEQKLNSWPNIVLNKNINFNKGIGKEFNQIRIRRNNLTHFTSDYESMNIEGIVINGLADTPSFDTLSKTDGSKALKVAKEFIEHILSLSGVKKNQLPHAVHQWTGIVPNKSLI